MAVKGTYCLGLNIPLPPRISATFLCGASTNGFFASPLESKSR